MIEKLDTISLLKKKVDQQRPLSKELIRSLKEDFLIKSTYHSNAIEGNTLTVYETKAVLEDGITIAGKSMREHLEAINHKEAILVAEEIVQQNQPFSEIVIKELHGIVLHSIDRANAGKYREQNVIISGASHTPPDAVVVPQLMTDLIEWYNATTNFHPVERAAILHSKFVNIHPFTDGNGRTARLLLNLELVQSGYLPIIIETERRFEYYELLDRAAVTGDYEGFVEFVVDYEEMELERYLEFLD
ncbi:cell filamentation protein Fic [Sporosarcina sp. P12(2017)]|uniref:Fic family protein n=1 Tax=unclassified Sporosarcina TaxID=2647733 RepID=UPI000C163634|nr:MULTISPECIES: Fic family protein [unclassified Sporosarcina]PIC56565.1 cell filamentation protein Fic [Sporosarcina sp. P10]PIC60216.1 cell filamentation protein Fic [Sporosarcina sp. P12(2017)]